jgi:hypothetical protein
MVTLQGEMFQALANYAAAGTIPPEVLIEADPTLPTKQKEKLLKMLEEKVQAQQQQQPSPAQQLESAEMEADILKTRAETQKIQVETQVTAQGG